MILTVRQAAKEDVYKDLVRIPEAHRRDHDGRRIKEGTICQITVEAGAGKTVISVRGLTGDTDPVIRMDDRTRLDLGVVEAASYDFELVRVWWIKQFWWAWNASDPAARIAARIGLLAVILGVVGVGLGLIALF